MSVADVLRSDRIARLHERFLEAGERFSTLFHVALRPDDQDWFNVYLLPDCPTTDDKFDEIERFCFFGTHMNLWRDVREDSQFTHSHHECVDGSPSYWMQIVRLFPKHWIGCYVDRDYEISDDDDDDVVDDVGVDTFRDLAEEACFEFSIPDWPEPPKWPAPFDAYEERVRRKHLCPHIKWLGTLYDVLAVPTERYGKVEVLWLPANVFSASAKVIELLADSPRNESKPSLFGNEQSVRGSNGAISDAETTDFNSSKERPDDAKVAWSICTDCLEPLADYMESWLRALELKTEERPRIQRLYDAVSGRECEYEEFVRAILSMRDWYVVDGPLRPPPADSPDIAFAVVWMEAHVSAEFANTFASRFMGLLQVWSAFSAWERKLWDEEDVVADTDKDGPEEWSLPKWRKEHGEEYAKRKRFVFRRLERFIFYVRNVSRLLTGQSAHRLALIKTSDLADDEQSVQGLSRPTSETEANDFNSSMERMKIAAKDWDRLGASGNNAQNKPAAAKESPEDVTRAESANSDGRPDVEDTSKAKGVGADTTASGVAQWFDEEPPEVSKFKYGPVEGKINQLAAWIEMDSRTLRDRNGKTSFWIMQCHRTKYAVWFSSQKQYATVNRERIAAEESNDMK